MSTDLYEYDIPHFPPSFRSINVGEIIFHNSKVKTYVALRNLTSSKNIQKTNTKIPHKKMQMPLPRTSVNLSSITSVRDHFRNLKIESHFEKYLKLMCN